MSFPCNRLHMFAKLVLEAVENKVFFTVWAKTPPQGQNYRCKLNASSSRKRVLGVGRSHA